MACIKGGRLLLKDGIAESRKICLFMYYNNTLKKCQVYRDNNN